MTMTPETLPTIAVADLHGHRSHLDALLAELDRVYLDGYRLMLLGDYVDNGPDTPGLLDRLIELEEERGPERFQAILGNHDLALLRTLGQPGTTPDEPWFQHWRRRFGGRTTQEAYGARSAAELSEKMPEAHVRFLEARPWFVDDGVHLFVHAGLEPGPLEPQLDALRAKTLPDGHLWTPQPLRNRQLGSVEDPSWSRVVVSAHVKNPAEAAPGHPHATHYLGEKRICLAGCVDDPKNQTLHAIALPERRLWSVGPNKEVRSQ